jgi:hypothetical protein
MLRGPRIYVIITYIYNNSYISLNKAYEIMVSIKEDVLRYKCFNVRKVQVSLGQQEARNACQ